MRLTSAQMDRACGVLLASAVGDALGAGYEFGSAAYDGWPAMIGGGLGGFAPGEWTDDTAQAVAIARVTMTGADLRTTEALDAIADGFCAWYAGGPADVGIQTSHVLGLAGRDATAAQLAAAAATVHERSGGRSAGNGSLMRTAPVALAHLDDPPALVEAARLVSALTHHDPMAGDGAALWCLMIRHAVLHGSFPTAGDVVPLLDGSHVEWAAILAEAETRPPSAFAENGWVVGALQGWGLPLAGHESGASALVAAAMLAVRGGRPDGRGWPTAARVEYAEWEAAGTCVPHPLVRDVWIGDVRGLDRLPAEVDAVVSLCRVGGDQALDLVSHQVRLLDSVPADNPNVDFVIDDAARTVLRLRDAGHRVYLHCVAGQSRTPTVAARVAVLDGVPLERALREVTAVLPGARPQGWLLDSLRRLDASTNGSPS